MPFFHALQYMFVAWAVQLRERLDTSTLGPSARYVVLETARWWLINVIGGVLLFVGLPYACVLLGQPPLIAVGVVVSAVQLHHFFVDGVIWKLKNPRVQSPLLVHLEDLVRSDPAGLAHAA